MGIPTKPLTQRQIDALQVLSDRDDERGMTPSGFALHFWPGKTFARSNGPWGLGPDASGRHGGKMLTRLYNMGLVNLRDGGDGLYYTARISHFGRNRLAEAKTEKSETSG